MPKLTDASVAAPQVLGADAPLLVPELTLGLDLPVQNSGVVVEDAIRLWVLTVVVDQRSCGQSKESEKEMVFYVGCIVCIY